MIRYLASLIILFGGIIISILPQGIKIRFLLDWHNFMIIAVLPFLFVCILYGFGEIRQAFSTPFRKETDKSQLLMSNNIFKYYGKTICIVCIFTMVIGLITIFTNTDNIKFLGKNIAVVLITPLYSAIIYIMVILPFKIIIKNRINKMEKIK